jgi:hypothetical protein
MPNPENIKPPTHDEAVERGRRGGLAKKGSKHLSSYIQEALTDENFELKLKDGTILKEMPIKAIIKTAVAKSVSGDTRAMEWLAKHGYGNLVRIEVDDPLDKLLGKFGIGVDDDAGKTEEA